MSKFHYMAEGELNSQYLQDLIGEYLNLLAESNDTKGISETNLSVNIKSAYFFQRMQDKFNKMRMSTAQKENYTMTQTLQRIKNIEEKIKVFLQTDVLQPNKIFEVEQYLKAVKLNKIIPQLKNNRNTAILKSEKVFSKVFKEIGFLRDTYSEHVLFNSPVTDLKPFISGKVSKHKVSIDDIKELFNDYIALRNQELNDFSALEESEVTFDVDATNFYALKVIEDGFGQEVEEFIRNKILAKVDISNHEEELPEDRQRKMAEIDIYLKKLKVFKLAKLMEKYAELKKFQARTKEIIEKCKAIIDKSTIVNKDKMFLSLDGEYYKISNACEKLANNIKLKLQAIDKQKLFDLVEQLDERAQNSKSPKKAPKRKEPKEERDETDNYPTSVDDMDFGFEEDVNDNQASDTSEDEQQDDIISSIFEQEYSAEPEDIHISEDSDDIDPEEEFVIDDEDEEDDE